MSCRFCSNGSCLICYLKAPTEVGIRTSYSADGELRDDGNRRAPAASSPEAKGTTRVLHQRKQGVLAKCPRCGKLCKDLVAHNHFFHPEAKLDLGAINEHRRAAKRGTETPTLS